MFSCHTRDVRQLRLVFPQGPIPLLGELGPAPDRLVPHDREVGLRGEVLGDGDGGVDVEDHVPPAPGHEDGLPRPLDGLDGFEPLRPVPGLGLGVDNVKPGDGLVPLLAALARLDRDQLLGRVRGEEAPALVAGDQRVPGRGSERVDVDPGARPRRPDHNPPVRRTLGLAAVLEQIVGEIFG